MGWAETRKASRLQVHARFAVSATYTAPISGAVPVDCKVRVHTKVSRFGDIDREGFAEVVQDLTRVIFLQSEVPEPRMNGVVAVIDGPLAGKSFTVEIVEPVDDDSIISCQVKP
jgi:hypothetical protein